MMRVDSAVSDCNCCRHEDKLVEQIDKLMEKLGLGFPFENTTVIEHSALVPGGEGFLSGHYNAGKDVSV